MKSYIKLQNMLGFGDTHLLSALLEKFKSPAGILSASDEELLACGLKKSQVKRKNSMSDKEAEKIINKCQKNNVWIIPYGHKNFPKKLMNIETPPVVIYGIGEIFDFDKNLSLALVGTRKISEFGKRAAFSLSARLSLANSIIISGGAIGCDSFAHLGALAAGGKTVAVTGGGVLSPYLKANKKLRDDIIKYGGALISEFTPDYVPRFKNSFQIRN